jgi:hypothetical protein
MDDGCEFYSNDPERPCVFWPANAVNLSGWQITFRGVEQFFFVCVPNTFAGTELGKAPGQTVVVRFVKAPELAQKIDYFTAFLPDDMQNESFVLTGSHH